MFRCFLSFQPQTFQDYEAMAKLKFHVHERHVNSSNETVKYFYSIMRIVYTI